MDGEPAQPQGQQTPHQPLHQSHSR
jgi:hypothetical protein